jgi:glycerophosphoryl diester phosphodiesterase
MACPRLRHLLLFAFIGGTAAGAAPVVPHVIGHRGLEHHAPENTVRNFDLSLLLHVGIEVDVRRSKDGVLVCLHDETVDRTTNGKGRVADLTFAELRQLDAGSHQSAYSAGEKIPAFTELIERLARARNSNLVVLLDLKVDDASVAEELVALARRHQVLDQVVFIGLTIIRPDIRARLRAADPNAQISVLAQSAADLKTSLADPHANWAYLRFVPSEADVRTIRARGMRVVVVGAPVVGVEPANWRRARDAGVDAIMTEYPLECRRELHFRPSK